MRMETTKQAPINNITRHEILTINKNLSIRHKIDFATYVIIFLNYEKIV